ncbi:hypothetical protein GCM10027277_10800 [Pseudoduganella ginsengisoli]
MWIDEFAAGWLAQLDDAAHALDDGWALYLLLDGVFAPGLHRRFSAALGDESVALLFETLPGCSDPVRDASPFVVRYAAGSRTMDGLLAQCSGRPMVSALETREPLNALAARLAAWCVVENDGQRFNFRFADTRRLPGIVRALDARQLGELAGPARRWHYVGRSGQWQALALPGDGHPVQERPQRLSDRQFGAMVDDSAADEMLVRLADRGVRHEGAPSVAHALVSQALAAADVAQLDARLRVDWCVECVRRGVRADEVRIMAALETWRIAAA